MDISDVHKNSKLIIDGIPYNVEVADFVKPGKGRAIYRFKLRNLFDGNILDRTFHSGEKVDEASIATEEKQYLYKEGEHYVFMNTSNFEQSFITEEQLGEKKDFLKEGEVVTVVMMGDKPLDIALPTFVELKVVKSIMSSKADTVTAQMKAAELETGFTIEVPTFVKEGDVIKVDTRSGRYVERVGAKK
ncbi:MAG: elongation factor P [Dehalococcoidales bacterium]|nr:elongation factor P [Dehalococcoidales bacterium]